MNNRLVNICPDSHKNLLKLFQIFQVLIFHTGIYYRNKNFIVIFQILIFVPKRIQGKHWTDEFTSIDKNIDIDFTSKDVQNTINEW